MKANLIKMKFDRNLQLYFTNSFHNITTEIKTHCNGIILTGIIISADTKKYYDFDSLTLYEMKYWQRIFAITSLVVFPFPKLIISSLTFRRCTQPNKFQISNKHCGSLEQQVYFAIFL